MKRIIAVNSNCYHGYTIEEAIAGIRKAGFHYIELTATKGWTEHVFPTMSFNDLNRVKDHLKAAGLTPFSLSGHTNLMDTARIGDFVNNMRLASFFGCDFIVSSIGEAHLKDQAVAGNEQVAAHIRDLLPYLEQYNLKLVLENHGEHSTGAVIKSIVELVGSPRVRLNYDSANVIYFAGIDPLAIADIREVVRYLTGRGIGVLITDHNVRETLDLVDRASIIHSGEVLFEGTPEEVRADPEVRRVYLGDSFG